MGTTSVEISEMLSKMLTMRKIEHSVLNAKLHQKEADIVATAGLKCAVTIATNMAGRGTDIKLSPEVKAAEIREELLKSAELTGIWEKKLREIEKKSYDASSNA